MKIVICGSMSRAQKMVEVADSLEDRGHVVILPKHSREYASGKFNLETQGESAQNKIKEDLIRDYYQKISQADAVLVVNERKSEIEDYIGGNAFLEMGFAHVLNKKIYLLNAIPHIGYKAEIVAMKPVCLLGDISKI